MALRGPTPSYPPTCPHTTNSSRCGTLGAMSETDIGALYTKLRTAKRGLARKQHALLAIARDLHNLGGFIREQVIPIGAALPKRALQPREPAEIVDAVTKYLRQREHVRQVEADYEKLHKRYPMA